ncbi:Crp/Fnr family transcriptional regulator [Maribacter confluentis]|uniref:cAMP-binding domain of CRP or a regulatory subunit of cAMP-dependent protein kinases n=2 Tax=Maribacter TaxID=252356 RepID=A0ABY1SCX7_9FLAO|nr:MULTISPECIES: Crp/Fnr family transcriptional regulator [Maribacter]MDO1513263.1 Crp/Fnr family transcriptional regulator [Maribacter confluentis]SNR27231.1 cAMP-binding domain of CRP or a regulatory subunit of cAMP-dependent protein kinases [Maribacter sedimenticola]
MKSIDLNNLETVEKGQILLKQGEIAKYGYFVKSGCLKSYAIDSSGKEHIMQFAPEDWLITDLDSFTNQVPSQVGIEAIEESEIFVLSRSEYSDITNFDEEDITEMAIKFRNNLIASNKRIIGLLSATAEQRYIDFTETYPTLVQRLPLKLIASYIGVTPEYLSDIRRKIAHK